MSTLSTPSQENKRPTVKARDGSLLLGKPQFKTLPPLSLYVHVPWCVRKCPYCDFNSHALQGEVPEQQYLEALSADLEQALPLIWGRQVVSVFIGGGTPSLLSASAMDQLLAMLRARLNLLPDAEITIEANPGTTEASRLQDYATSGVNRISLGIQSFHDDSLRALGRIHDAQQARTAIAIAQKVVPQVNLDIMFGLPNQDMAAMERDLHEAMSFGTQHISFYHLTLEPNTVFAKYPPPIPDDDLGAAMQDQGAFLLEAHGWERYEVSAYAKQASQCRHNRNYWEFGDYLGIGPGAHGKLTMHDRIERHAKLRNPDSWMSSAIKRDGSHVAETRQVMADEVTFEFMLNALRLKDGVPSNYYNERTGQPFLQAERAVKKAVVRGLMESGVGRLQATPLGWQFLNDLQSLFLE